jgi:TonB family protein
LPPTLRFGYEGPTRYVHLLQVEAEPGRPDALTNVGRVTPLAGARKGGGGGEAVAARVTRHLRSSPSNRTGPGDDVQNLAARALATQGRVPIFQSEELIIEHLVRPVYPDKARERGIEGRVAVLAHVDTMGVVMEAEVLTPSGEVELDHAAEMAVRQCRFRPYRVAGAPQEVYAVFRFRFRLTEP